MAHIFHVLTIALYAAATAAYLACLFCSSDTIILWGRRILAGGCFAHILSTIHLVSLKRHLPLTEMQESLSFLALLLVVFFLFFERKYRVATLGSFITPLALLMLIVSGGLHGEARELPPILQSNWFWFHTMLAFMSYAAFAIACGVAVIYLLQRHFLKKKNLGPLFRRLPSLETLDEISYRALSAGFPLLTAAIISGAIWSEQAAGSYWTWDPKQTWSFVTWLVYAALLHGRLTAGWRGRRAAILSIIGFIAVLVTFLGVKHGISW